MSRRSEIEYFKISKGAPESLLAAAERRVRFEEVDSMGIVWHGRYASYFEDVRAVIGEKYGIGCKDMEREKFRAPIVKMHIEYHNSLTFSEDFRIKAQLHWTEAVRMNISYKIETFTGRIIASGYTVQLFTDIDGKVLLVFPEYLDIFLKKWRNKEF